MPRGSHSIAEEDKHYNDRTKLGTKTHARVSEISKKESSYNINPPSPSEIRNRREDIWGKDRAMNRNSDLEKRKSYGRDTRDKEHEPEGRDREHRRREKDRNDGAQHRRTEREKEDKKGRSSDKPVMERLDPTEPHYVRKIVNERLRGLEEKNCNKRAPSTDRPAGARTGRESVAGDSGGSGGLEKWGDFDMYTKRRRRE